MRRAFEIRVAFTPARGPAERLGGAYETVTPIVVRTPQAGASTPNGEVEVVAEDAQQVGGRRA